VEEKREEKPKKGKGKSGAFDLKDIFSESFRDRLSQYIRLNEEVLNMIAEAEGTDKSDEITKRKDNMAERVEQAAADILKLELGALEEWIGEQQVGLSNDIVRIGKAYEETRSNLLSTGAFSEGEIASNLDIIQARSSEKQKAYDSYQDLIHRSKNIYS
jgi:hypothetical protein